MQIFYFNPDNEMAIANGSSHYMPPANIRKMAEDLAFLPAYFTGDGDGVIVTNDFPAEFAEKQRELFGISPELCTFNKLPPNSDYRLEAWGVSPRLDSLFGQSLWKEEFRDLVSRKTAKTCLERLVEIFPELETKIIPDIVYSIEELECILIKSEQGVVVKSPWSSSGKGQLRLTNSYISSKEQEWLQGVLNKQGYFMVEPLLDKILDFAMQFRCESRSVVSYKGYSSYITDSSGKYKGNYVCSQAAFENKITAYISAGFLEEIRHALVDILSELFTSYKGYLGVDMMIYRDLQGKYRLQPCVEINVRYNMGLLSSAIYNRLVAPTSSGFFSIDFHSQRGEALKIHNNKLNAHPLEMKNGRIVSGYTNLTPVNETTSFVVSICIQDVSFPML
ncbi:MAG: hypothetical protein LBM07_01035 [Culturomica sp.]|nr:hypothetical protein [Culturomica sp.]